jgi:hypothetical protein
MNLTDGLRETARLHRASSESAIAGLHAAASKIVEYRKFLQEIRADLSEYGEPYSGKIIDNIRKQITDFLETNK